MNSPYNQGPDGPINIQLILDQLSMMDDGSALPIERRVSLLDALMDHAIAADRAETDTILTFLERARDRGPASTIAFDLYSGHIAIRAEEYGRAEVHCVSGRKLALSLGWEAEVAFFCLIHATVAYRRGRYGLARTHLEESVVASRRSGSQQLEGRAMMNLGLILKNTGELREAERLLRASLALADRVGITAATARCELNLANVLLRRGSPSESRDLANKSGAKFSALNYKGHWVLAQIAEARALRGMGDPKRARQLLELALDEARTSNEPRSTILSLEFLGDCELDLGDADTAREHYQEALVFARGHGESSDLLLECLRGLASVELARGERMVALSLVEEAIRIAREQGDSFELGASLIVLGDVLVGLGRIPDVIIALEEAWDLGRKIGADVLATQASMRLAKTQLSPTSEVGSPRSSSTRSAQSRDEAASQLPGFLTVDSGLLRTLATVKKLAPRRLNVLIHGESGTGKELIAQAVHSESGRRGPFVPVNCSAFPGDLIEGELFGHARGAYTGADRERVGLFEHANKGTLFLDEIGDMPIKAQARLLRALESGEVRRLGENNARLVDVRVVAATHRDLMTMVGAGEFRLDLYYRLAGYVVELPPIRERVEDAKLLIDHYLARFAREQGKSITMAPELRQQLASHSWPGNVREIRLVMDRLVSLSEDGAVLRTLPFALEGEPRPRSLPEVLEAEEKRRILDALQSHNWNKQRAATTLGTNRTTLIGKMKRMGISSRKP
jgi:DNA-binding NtrC family response regulator